MATLHPSTLSHLPTAIEQPGYNRDTTEIGIVHLGPGAFHRAHQAVYTEQALAEGGNWQICGVSLRSDTLKQALAPQDNLYTLMIVDREPAVSIIGSLKEVLVLKDDRQTVMARMCAAQTCIISLTITEKGYCLDSQDCLDLSHSDIQYDLSHPQTPRSTIGLLTAALAQRMEEKRSELTIISCDNLPHNGEKLKAAVLAFAQQQNPALATWIDTQICFPDTMVDSITPASHSGLEATAQQATGLHDSWPVQREAFTQWVIEDNFSGPRPAWEKYGVVFTHDVQVFEKAKLRILNASHSALAYIGSLAGFETVFDAISNTTIKAYIEQLLQQEILPTIAENADLTPQHYAQAILKRFENPHIRHLLAQIAWDGSKKLSPRILDTVRDNLAASRPIDMLCTVVAAWIVFVASQAKAKHPLTDPLAEALYSMAARHANAITAIATELLADKRIFAELVDHPIFRNTTLNKVTLLAECDAQTVLAKIDTLLR